MKYGNHGGKSKGSKGTGKVQHGNVGPRPKGGKGNK